MAQGLLTLLPKVNFISSSVPKLSTLEAFKCQVQQPTHMLLFYDFWPQSLSVSLWHLRAQIKAPPNKRAKVRSPQIGLVSRLSRGYSPNLLDLVATGVADFLIGLSHMPDR